MKQKRHQTDMDGPAAFSPDRSVLCLFDVDGTLTPPREVGGPQGNEVITVVSHSGSHGTNCNECVIDVF